MAVHGLKGLGWFLCGVVVAPSCYLVNSHGAAEQARLNATRLAILQAQKDIRGLETEFNTRANLAQLERWNGDVLALAAPAPQQYLAGEAQLASLDQPTPVADVQLAALIVPSGVPAAPAPVPAAVPAQPAAAPAQPVATPARVAAQDGALKKLMKKADRQALASVDGGVLSASTIDDLEKLAKREKLALR